MLENANADIFSLDDSFDVKRAVAEIAKSYEPATLEAQNAYIYQIIDELESRVKYLKSFVNYN